MAFFSATIAALRLATSSRLGEVCSIRLPFEQALVDSPTHPIPAANSEHLGFSKHVPSDANPNTRLPANDLSHLGPSLDPSFTTVSQPSGEIPHSTPATYVTAT